MFTSSSTMRTWATGARYHVGASAARALRRPQACCFLRRFRRPAEPRLGARAPGLPRAVLLLRRPRAAAARPAAAPRAGPAARRGTPRPRPARSGPGSCPGAPSRCRWQMARPEPGALLLRRVEGDEDAAPAPPRGSPGRCRGTAPRRRPPRREPSRQKASSSRATPRRDRSRPPAGIAWNAFSARFRNTCLSCSASAFTRGSHSASSSSTADVRRRDLALEQLERLLEHVVHVGRRERGLERAASSRGTG